MIWKVLLLCIHVYPKKSQWNALIDKDKMCWQGKLNVYENNRLTTYMLRFMVVKNLLNFYAIFITESKTFKIEETYTSLNILLKGAFMVDIQCINQGDRTMVEKNHQCPVLLY